MGQKGQKMTFFGLFGNAASQAQPQRVDTKTRFEKLKLKYEPALNTANKEHILFQSIHVMDDKLFVRATAPSQEARNLFWHAIKDVDPEAKDITAEIGVAGGADKSSLDAKTYVVMQGDTLSKISKEFYGDPDEYVKIHFANPGKIDNQRNVRVGQKLTIPYD
jgi:nucleoid-associated protein YgaU